MPHNSQAGWPKAGAAAEQVEEILDQFLIYGQTVSSIVVSTPVPLRPLPVPQAS